MRTNFGSRGHGRVFTHLSAELRSKMTSADSLKNSLSAGSKKRLIDYQTNLAVTSKGSHENFDNTLIQAILPYVYDKRNFMNQLDYLNHLVDDDGEKFSRCLKVYSKIEESMKLFSSPDYTSFRWNRNYQTAKKSLIDEFSKMKLKPVSYNSDDDIRDVLPKADSHSGFYYIISGKRYKGENIEGLIDIFKNKLEEVKKTGTFGTPIMIAFRTQASGEYDDEGNQTNKCKHKVRVVSMIDLLWVVAEFMFLKPLQQRLAREEFYAGGKNDYQISAIIHDWQVRHKRFISLDYSSFDQSISGWLLEDAFEIMGAAFTMNQEQKDLWKILTHDAIHKDFILNEGILHSDRGMPSGLPSTQIGDTVVNRLIAMTYFNAINQKFKMIAMGDDNLMYTNANVNLNEFASYVLKNFGMVVKTDDKSSEGNAWEPPKFLSRYWKVSGTWRHPNQLISRMAFPERFRKYGFVKGIEVTPFMVIYAYYLSYPSGMRELIDVNRFILEHPMVEVEVLKRVDSHYLPGVIAYQREYLAA